jgi:hypothetical protein
VTENGRRRKIFERELGIRQLVDKFAMAEVQATRILLGLMLERERGWWRRRRHLTSGHPLAPLTRW